MKNKFHEIYIYIGLFFSQKTSKEKCLFFPLRDKMWYMKSNIKAEVIKRKPLIVYFHEFIDNKTVKALKYMGHETVSSILFVAMAHLTKLCLHIR